MRRSVHNATISCDDSARLRLPHPRASSTGLSRDRRRGRFGGPLERLLRPALHAPIRAVSMGPRRLRPVDVDPRRRRSRESYGWVYSRARRPTTSRPVDIALDGPMETGW